MRNISAYIWGLLGKLVPQVIYLCTTFVLARFISPSDFGQIGVLAIFTSVSHTLLEAGLGGSLIKEDNVTEKDYSTIFVFNIAVSYVLYVIIFLCAPWIENFYKIPGLSDVCRIICLVFVINAWGQIAQTILFRELMFKTLMMSSVTSVITGSIIAIVTAVWFKWGVYSLVGYQLVQSATYVILNWYKCKFKPTFQFSAASFKKLYSFGMYTTVIGIVESIYENLITSFFGKYLGITQAGFFSQAKKIETACVNSLSGTINSVAFPILTRLKTERGEFEKESSLLLKNLSLVVLPILLMVSLISEIIIYLLFGKQWMPAASYLSLLMWVGCFFVLEAANRNYIKSLGYVHSLLKVTIIKRVIGITIMVFCIVYDTTWLIYGYLFGAIIGYCANAFCYSNIIGKSKLSYSISSLRYGIMPVSCFILGWLLKVLIPMSPIAYTTIVIALFTAYYFLILPKLGINLLNLVHLKKK